MTIWIDAQLSPSLARWISETFGFPAQAVRDLGLREAKDFAIFQAARKAVATVLTKDADFPRLLEQHGPPPKVLWLTCETPRMRTFGAFWLQLLQPPWRFSNPETRSWRSPGQHHPEPYRRPARRGPPSG